MPTVIDGLIVIDKPAAWTSHDVVAKLRGVFHQKRIGHSGTLDPDATGVLLVGLGRVTRLLRYLTALPKTYTAEVVLGVETDTLDASGEVTARHDMAAVTLADVTSAAAGLTGEIEQVPPMVSAVKVGGRRLHELARAGEEVERAPRSVTVHRFEVAAGPEPGVFAIEAVCSSGTYVRTLAADLGAALGGGAHLRNLRRTAIGSFQLSDAHPLDAVVAAGPDGATALVLPPAAALRDYAAVAVEREIAARVSHGARLALDELGATGDGPWAVVRAGEGELLAVYEAHRGGAKPAVVVAPEVP